jgi:flagellin-like hook-associated protein FlgL
MKVKKLCEVTSVVIQNNLSATNAHNRLNKNVVGVTKSSEKLSSGFRINRAGDDAAGLAVSEKMRTQVRGLSQAVRNGNDGISFIQTAEGALEETHALTKRIKELTVQSANGTYTNDDRALMQLEIDALKTEIDRIAEATDFNGIRMLNGGMVNIVTEIVTETITPQCPVIAVGGGIFGGDPFVPVRVSAGTQSGQPISAANTHLETLNIGPNFPREGVFVIRAGIPGGAEPGGLVGPQSRTAVLDFGTLNPSGDFDLNDFISFYKGTIIGSDPVTGNDIYDGGAFSDWINAGELFFDVTTAGGIDVRTIGLGGNGTFVHVGDISHHISGDIYPAGFAFGANTVFANSAIFGATDNTSTGESWIKTTRPLTDTELTALGATIGSTLPNVISLDPALAINCEDLWAALPSNTNVTFGLEEWIPNSWGGFSPVSVPDSGVLFPKTGDNIQGFVDSITSHSGTTHFSSFGLTPTFAVDRDGYVLVNFTDSAIRTSAFSGSSYHTIFSYPRTSGHNVASHNANNITSSFPAAVSENIGQLRVSVRVPTDGLPCNVNPEISIPIAWGNVTIDIDFSDNSISFTTLAGTAKTLYFTDVDSMKDQMNAALNDPENHPTPLPRFTNNAYSNQVATVDIVNNRLVITPAERHSTVNIRETQSDRPMFVNSRLEDPPGFPTTQNLTITGTPYGTTEIELTPGDYTSAHDFWVKNRDAFAPRYSLHYREEDSKLEIRTVNAVGSSASITGFSPWELAEALGFGIADVYSPERNSPNSSPISESRPRSDGFPIHGIDWTSYDIDREQIVSFDWGKKEWLIQVGDRNSEHTRVTVAIGSMTTSGLKIQNLDISTQTNAISALGLLGDDGEREVLAADNTANEGTIDHANFLVSAQRASLGALQNRLEHTVNSLTTTVENVISAESQIRDTDMAMEMLKYTKYGILQQAAQAMLAQANQAPQGILQLLR